MIGMIIQNKYLVLGLAFLVGVVMWYTLRDSSASPELLVTEDLSTPASEAEKDLVATLLQLRSVTLEGSIFSDPGFQSLIDFGSEIIPEPVGRPNPFAPLGQRAIPQPSTPQN